MVMFDYRRKIWKEVLDFASKIKGRTLDLGCGNGTTTRLIKDCVGLDVSMDLLKKAQKTAKNAFIQGNCEALSFENESFDNVLLVAVLHNLKSRERVKCLGEIHRVLRKKGNLFLSVWSKYKSGVKYIKWVNEKRYYYFFKEKELKDLLINSGFKVKKFVKSGDNWFVECVKGPAEI